jgi:hypothetical protein
MAAPIIGEYGIGIRFAWRSFLQGDWVVAVLENLQPPLPVAVITITTQFLLTIVGRCGRPFFFKPRSNGTTIEKFAARKASGQGKAANVA